MWILLKHDFRSSTSKLCVMSLVLPFPYGYRLMFLSVKDKVLTVNINNKTDRLSPWNIFFNIFMESDIIVSFLLLRWSVIHHWIIGWFNCFRCLECCKSYIIHSCRTESSALLKEFFLFFLTSNITALLISSLSVQPYTPFLHVAFSGVMILFWLHWSVTNMFKQLLHKLLYLTSQV